MPRLTLERCQQYMNRKDRHWDEYDVQAFAPRKIKKKLLGTRRRRTREHLETMRKQERCKHQIWYTSYSPIADEPWRDEPDHDYCADCGMTEMEFEARRGNKFWQRHYPQRESNSRRRTIERLEDQFCIAAARRLMRKAEMAE